MAKTNATFKLGKMAKLSMGSTFDKAARTEYKKCMIDAQSTYIANRNRKFSDPATSQKSRENREAPKE